MIINENKEASNEAVPLDAPPAYDVINRLPSQSQESATRSTFNDEKDRSLFSSLRPEAAASGSSSPHSAQAVPPSSSSSSWFRLGVFGSPPAQQSTSSTPNAIPPTAKSQADLRATVQELVRDLVTSVSTNGTMWTENVSASFGVLDSCAAACIRQHVSLSSILQERSIEEHTPLYWAIIKRPPRTSEARGSLINYEVSEEDAVIWKILSLSVPLTSYTLFEMRLACLATHSNDLLQRLRYSPIAFPLTGSEKMLLSGSNSGQHRPRKGFRDTVEVVEGTATGKLGDAQTFVAGNGKDADENGEGGFRVKLELEMFQRRMSVGGSVAIEIIARGRLWQLTFFVVPPLYPYLSANPPSESIEPRIPYAAISSLRALPQPPAPGMWACCLSTAPGSPQCWLDSRVFIRHPSSDPSKQPLTLRLRTNSHPLQAHNPPPYTPIPLSLDASGSSSPSFFSSFSNPAEANMTKEDKEALSQARKLGKNRVGREKRLKQGWQSPEDSESRKEEERSVIVEVLDERGMGKLMYDNCPYIAKDGVLRATFEAHLSPRKPEVDRTECIIC